MSATTYVHHRVVAAPRQWAGVAAALSGQSETLAARGGALYGLWRSQIGRPRDEITAITVWRQPIDADQAERLLLGNTPNVSATHSDTMLPTLRPSDPLPPTRQGNFAFRWFVTPEVRWGEFLDLCAQAWPGFERAYDSQVIGLWRCTGASRPVPAVDGGTIAGIRSLLLTRRPDLAMWERSKLPQGADETAVRETLSRRYDLCDWTVVHTTTLLTASDTQDNARWA